MKAKRIAILTLLILAAVVIILFVVRFANLRGQEEALSIDEIQTAEGFPVDVREITRGNVSRYLEILGNVQGLEQVDIRSSLPIDITDVLKQEGDRVKKGEVVVRLARDRRGQAFHQYSTAKQMLDNAKLDLTRMENLHEEGAVSGQMLEQAQLAYKNAKAQYNEAVSMVDLISPIDGIVTMVGASEGTTAVPGEALVTVATIDRVRIRCFVGHEEIKQIQVGQVARIQTGSSGGEDQSSIIKGTVTRVAMSSDPETMLFPVEVMADNPGEQLKPGSVASLALLVEEKENVLNVTMDALVQREGKNYVYLVRSNQAKLAPLTLGMSNGKVAEITNGLSPGDTLVVRGQYRLSDNVKVLIRHFEGMN
jgi:membrane fusion protein (multidrug efflux system)